MSEWKRYFILLTLLVTVNLIQSQTYQSLMILQEIGTDFIPANPIELIATYTDTATLMLCYQQCNLNPLCRTFVSGTTWPFICRLYQGSIDTGSIVVSLSSTSRVGGLHYDVSLYKNYNQACDSHLPPFDRYLTCNNGLWDCPTATYWDGSMCVNQVYYRATCNMDKECREDIGLTCSSSPCNICSCNTSTIWNSTACVSSTCPSLLPTDPDLLTLWLLNDDVDDSMNNYNGTIIGNVTFVTGYSYQAAQFSNDGYILFSYIDFYQRSFTVELWLYLTNITDTPMALFTTCASPIDNECLHIGIIAFTQLGLNFWSDDAASTTVLVANQWYHAAFVYDYDQRQRFIYLNGVPETIVLSNPVGTHLYLGQSGNAIIGGISFFSSGFIGYIDQVSVTYRVKTADEILDDASLVAYYSFDCGTTLDSGPNLLHGSANGITVVIGPRNQAIAFDSATAYFQASGFTALGTSNQSFSISLWIKPLNTNGTLVHLSSESTGNGSCTTILGFNVSGNIIAQILDADVSGPVPALNVWTHIIYTFSVINGIRLYINGILYVSSGGDITRVAPDIPLYVTIANQLSGAGSCISGNISNAPYVGAIDELRVYNREISASEVCTLYS